MKEFKMRFKDFVFDTNPMYIQVITSRDIAADSAYGDKSIVQDIAQKPIIVKGKGMFFGDEAQEKCERLSYMLNLGGVGELHCPSLYPINAIFTRFQYDANAQSGKIEYEFEFTQVCDKSAKPISLDYTYAKKKENAFDIAARVGISVDEIMRLNDFENPFNINENERVNLK